MLLVSPVRFCGAFVLVALAAVAFSAASCQCSDNNISDGGPRPTDSSFLHKVTVCVKWDGQGCGLDLAGPVLTNKINLAIPWRVAVSDQNLDGFNDLAVAFGGDWNPQWIVGFNGDTSSCNGFWAGASWASEDVGYTSRLRYADMNADGRAELLASTYFGRRRPGNSGPSGSGLRMYSPPPPKQPVSCNSGHLDVVTPAMLIGCAQTTDFQVADVDGDGDQDILAALHAIDLECPEVDSLFRFSGCDLIMKLRSSARLPKVARPDGFAAPDDALQIDGLQRSLSFDRLSRWRPIEPEWTVDDPAETPAQFWHSEDVATPTQTAVGRQPQPPDAAPPEAAPAGATTGAEEPVHIAARSKLMHISAAKSEPPRRHIEGNVLALFLNEGDPGSPQFVGPSWFGRLQGRASRTELFDIDGDGYLELIVALLHERIYAVRGGDEGPRLADREKIADYPKNADDPEDWRVLAFGADDQRLTSDFIVALLPRSALPAGVAGAGGVDRGFIARADEADPPKEGERDLHVVLVESRVAVPPSRDQTGQIVLHVVGGGSRVLWEGPITAGHPLSLAWLDRPLDEVAGQPPGRLFSPLVLVGRGHWRGKFEIHGAPGDVLPLWRPEDRRELFEEPVAGLDLEVMGEFGADEGAWMFEARLKGRAVTLPGVGPIRIDDVGDAIRIDGADVPRCTTATKATAGAPRCFTFAEGARAVVIRHGDGELPPEATIVVKFRSARFQDVAAADSRLGHGPVVAWDARRAVEASAP